MIIDVNEIRRQFAECYMDSTRIKFIETFLSTFDATKGKTIPFRLFPRQKVFLTGLADNRNVVAIKPRQCGITTLTSAWVTAQCVFASTESPETVLCIANKLEQAQEILIKIKDFLLQVPRWMWGDEYFSTDPKSEKNEKSIFVKDAKSMIQLFNGCRIIARASKPNAARGISAVSVLVLDEAAFIEEGAVVYGNASATMASNPNSKTVMVSTPNGKDELYYQTYRKALSKENNFVAVEFKWFQDPRFNKHLKWYKKDKSTGQLSWNEDETISADGEVPYNEERWAKLEHDGWKPTSPWYEEMCKSLNNDTMRIAQELDVSFMGSSDNVVASEFIEMQATLNVRTPLEDFNDPLNVDTWFWKPPIEGHRYILACDPSRGTSADQTAIEIIDMDGRDDNGLPIIEQVGEYLGKKLGDEIGAMLYNYGTLYNEAFVVIDATGGQGDAATITLLNMGYKNMYYEDANQKTYMIQNSTKKYDSYTNRLPGFHFQGNRYPVLSNFAGMVRSNEFKIRSSRVINELDTWIFKGDNARMDHQSGSHDDTITALAMGLFVMQYSVNRIDQTIKRDKAILNAYMMSFGSTTRKRASDGVIMSAPASLPFYSGNKVGKLKNGNISGTYMWLFGGRK